MRVISCVWVLTFHTVIEVANKSDNPLKMATWLRGIIGQVRELSDFVTVAQPFMLNNAAADGK